ncbi:MAG TPA: PTS galactitol transporter subunit IIB [Chloroflexi bacterium]|nr:PTS galactitol transporter subunit IIB [Chloroflexota bacterium]
MAKQKKKILILCGSGAASSTVVANQIKIELEARGIPVEVEQRGTVYGGMGPINEAAERSDLVIVMGRPDDYKFSTPAVPGLAFLTGVGVDEILDEIVRILQGE